jgi:lipoprotein-anchoring transpeptidase ErfK/SrfK
MRRSRAVLAAGAVAAAVSAAFAAPARPADGSALPRQGGAVAWPRGSSLALRSAPRSGRVLAVVGRRTEFGSRTSLPVVAFRGRWAEVISPLLPNGVHGFVPLGQVTLSHDPVALEVDLSRRQLRVWRSGTVRRWVTVAIGARSSPTPIGRFAVTDELVGFHTSAYGCCILALSGHQTHRPPGWTGGDRLAIHGGGGIGAPVSNGCLHASEANLRWLLRRIPLGTQIVIHP